MIVEHVFVRDFRGLKNFETKLGSRVMVCGPPASGKSRLLQSIGAPLSRATRKYPPAESLPACGFRPFSMREASVDLLVRFSKDELDATHELSKIYSKDSEAYGKKPVFSSFDPTATLSMTRGEVRTLGDASRHAQFMGRFVVRVMVKGRQDLVDYFPRTGDLFYYDYNDGFRDAISEATRFFAAWDRRQAFEIDSVMSDFQKVFPETSLERITASAIEFKKDGVFYTLDEASTGEKQVFCTLTNMQKMHVHNSVILIEDPDAHLDDEAMEDFWDVIHKKLPSSQIIATCKFPIDNTDIQIVDMMPEE